MFAAMPSFTTLMLAVGASASVGVRCGILSNSAARDGDSLCIHLEHTASHVGELRLLNSSALNTTHSQLPETIASGTTASFAVRDGVFWQATGGSKSGGRLDPFSFTVWYRGSCHKHTCSDAAAFYDVGVTLSLRRVGGPVSGVHVASGSVGHSLNAPAASAPRYEASWTRCLLEATFRLVDGPVGTADAPALSTRAVDAASEQSLWCDESDIPASAKGHHLGGIASIDLQNAPDACQELAEAAAANEVHIRYFLMQQQVERDLLDNIENGLCGSSMSGPPDEVTFAQTLERLLQPFRMATRLHIYMAFVAKGVCARNVHVDRQRAMEEAQLLQLPSYAAGYFDLAVSPEEYLKRHGKEAEAASVYGSEWAPTDEPGRATWVHLLSPYSHEVNASVNGHKLWRRAPVMSVDPLYLPDQPDPTKDFCPLPILHHEPWNTQESWAMWNISSYLLQTGAAFCAPAGAAARAARITMWRAHLTHLATMHRGNNAFIVYSAAYDAPCRLLEIDAEARAGLRGDIDWTTHRARAQEVHAADMTRKLEAIRSQGACDLANVTTIDLLHALGNDTNVAFAMGKRLLQGVIMHDADGPTGCPDVLTAARVSEIDVALGTIPVADERVDQYMGDRGIWTLTLGSAYHKIVPWCSPADPLYKRVSPTTNWACVRQPRPAEPEGLIVYDLVPMDATRGYCYGEPCRRAARAYDAYRAFLHVFSRYRSSVVYALLSAECPYADSSGGFQSDLEQLIRDWPSVLQQLWDARSSLQASCVAPSRMEQRGVIENWRFIEREMAEEARERAKHATGSVGGGGGGGGDSPVYTSSSSPPTPSPPPPTPFAATSVRDLPVPRPQTATLPARQVAQPTSTASISGDALASWRADALASSTQHDVSQRPAAASAVVEADAGASPNTIIFLVLAALVACGLAASCLLRWQRAPKPGVWFSPDDDDADMAEDRDEAEVAGLIALAESIKKASAFDTEHGR